MIGPCEGFEDLIFGDHGVRPIFVAHMLKTLIAAKDESRALRDHPDRNRPLLAYPRFLASPIREHGLASAVEDALRFVVAGKTPNRLTPGSDQIVGEFELLATRLRSWVC